MTIAPWRLVIEPGEVALMMMHDEHAALAMPLLAVIAVDNAREIGSVVVGLQRYDYKTTLIASGADTVAGFYEHLMLTVQQMPGVNPDVFRVPSTCPSPTQEHQRDNERLREAIEYSRTVETVYSRAIETEDAGGADAIRRVGYPRNAERNPGGLT